ASEVILQAPRPAAGPTVEAEEPVRSAPQPSAAAARGTDDTTAPLEPVDLEQAGLPPVRAADTDEATTPLPGKPQPGPDRPVTDPEATTQSWPAPDALPADPAGADVADEPTAVMPAVTPAGAAPPSSVIMGVLCPQGHSSAPDTRRCRVCGRAVEPQAPRPVPRPSLARLRTSDGALVEVDRPVVIGRAPSEEHAGGALPRLLTVASPHHDISRSHLLVAPDGWTLVATDLRSTNGTLIVWPETGSRKPLEPNEPTPIPLGARLDLGDGITVTVEGLG
ncbi:MAG: FHA domain-containing protein, partial [Actinomycetes bacterium]